MQIAMTWEVDMVYARVKDRCAAYGYKIGRLETELGVYKGFFNNVAQGRNSITDAQMKKLARFLETTPEYLNGLTDDPRPKRVPEFSVSRFKERCVAKKVTTGYAESRVEMPKGYLEQLADMGMNPAEEDVRALAILLDTTEEYLLGLTDDPGIPSDDRTGIKIKVFGEVAAGIPIQQIDNFDPDDANSWEEIDRKTARNGTYFALRIKGESMMPEIKDGAVVIVRKQNTAESGDLAVVAINGDTATCKKVVMAENGIYLMPINPAYPPQFYTNEQIQKLPVRILGVVEEARNKYKR